MAASGRLRRRTTGAWSAVQTHLNTLHERYGNTLGSGAMSAHSICILHFERAWVCMTDPLEASGRPAIGAGRHDDPLWSEPWISR
jgi:hypothetical protein